MSRLALGLDLGQSLGWSVFHGSELVAFGVRPLKRWQPVRAVQTLAGLVTAWSPDVVAIESVNFAVTVGAHAGHWRVRTLAELALDQLEQLDRLVEIDATSLKRFATGRGNAPKALVCAAARARFGVDLWARGELEEDHVSKAERGRQEDQADALFVGAWAATAKDLRKARRV